MDGGAAGMGGIKIDKLTETNFLEWRQRIKMSARKSLPAAL